jgi:hypothetical protein
MALPSHGFRLAHSVSIDRVAAALLIGLPIAFNVFFFLLARLFDYPG